MEIQVRLECAVSLQDGEVNINEILHAVGKWVSSSPLFDAESRSVSRSICRELIEVGTFERGKSIGRA